jgi:hypothetical protein
MSNALSEQEFEKWYESHAKYSTHSSDTALAGWQACAQQARKNHWAAFSPEELRELDNFLSQAHIDSWGYRREIAAELERRNEGC